MNAKRKNAVAISVPLGQSEMAATLCRLQPSGARSLHAEFIGMYESAKHHAWESNKRHNRRPSKLEFLEAQVDKLNPEVGRFKCLHLLACDLANVAKRAKTLPDLFGRICKLTSLFVTYDERCEEPNPAISHYAEVVLAELGEDHLDLIHREVDRLVKQAIEEELDERKAFALLFMCLRYDNEADAINLICVINAQSERMSGWEESLLREAQEIYPNTPWKTVHDNKQATL